MNRPTHHVLALFLALATTPRAPEAQAQPAKPGSTLLTHDQLQARLADSNASASLRLLDVRPRLDYDKGHIPGAVWLDLKSTSTLAARPGNLTDQAAWEAWIRPLGIGPDTEVFVYDAQRQLQAARVWWLLTYLGVRKAGLIDGGFLLWAEAKRPVSSASTHVEARPFRIRFQKDRLATREDALEAIKTGSDQIIDARTLEEYTGAKALTRRGGHMPGACRLEWTELVDKDGRFLDPGVLKSKLAASGVKSSAAIAHCQSGGRSSVDTFVLERLGIATRNYYLGWSDWGNAEDTPVASGDPPDGNGSGKP
jgi:thiosulfate/3-mercaptopyruvate sulfurtransferase